jgi:hypothetical protein
MVERTDAVFAQWRVGVVGGKNGGEICQNGTRSHVNFLFCLDVAILVSSNSSGFIFAAAAMTTGEASTKSPLASLPPVVASHLQKVLGDEALENSVIREAKSAQQQVFILTFTINHVFAPSCWNEALKSGNNTLVVRIWKGSARWWNLHCSHAHSEFNECNTEPGVWLLARAEVSGYRLARKALRDAKVTIPQVLYFSHDSIECIEKEPWAIMSYVGPQSCFFQDGRVATDEWLNGMITIRHEFGFEEPHPRWGRVPVDQCLDYVFHVLERFTIPMHRYFLAHCNNEDIVSSCQANDNIYTLKPRRYTDMIQLYKKAHEMMLQGISNKSDHEALTRIVQTLGQCIHKLQQESVQNLPLVLCHMDCQPQNLIFYCQDNNTKPQLHSVLDWEEAAWADPRFELLLLCRKVCASRIQANTVWDFYTREMQNVGQDFVVGPIDPWLQLETVHSITTLVLQSMNLLNGGRSPWETKPDLLGKIEREFQRLEMMGWTFCNTINLNSEIQ